MDTFEPPAAYPAGYVLTAQDAAYINSRLHPVNARNQWCYAADHHDWLHMLLDRRTHERDDAYIAYADLCRTTHLTGPGT
jgi:hypothetical protein